VATSATTPRSTTSTTKFERIEKFGFEGFSPSKAELQRRLETSRLSFQKYLTALGYEPKLGNL
jgi:hypothetical protein